MSYALIFPGQGSQFVGMGKDWAEAHEPARRTFEEADDALGFSISTLCFEGPGDELQLTANTQPAILACSVAVLRSLSAYGDLAPAAVAGHSLGEYSALVAAGVLELGDALRLVRRRGELMQEAVPVGEGAMAAIIGLDHEPLQTVLDGIDASDHRVVIANLNSPGQLVIAGHADAVETAAARAKEAGAKLAKLLPVSAPFHSPLMKPAREGLEGDLRATTFRDPKYPVVCNIDAQPVADGAAARDALERQIDGPVRWIESMEHVLEVVGAKTLGEIGPGKVLTGLGKRIDRSASWLTSPSPDALDQFFDSLKVP
ncbi:MAG: ACP S-malonyltransferase [Thermoanaerobaculia bacterium]|nr:ACP S-malonyltransferase [Thermoanaerobaculia bacterium]